MLQAAFDRAPQNPALKADLIRVEAQIGGLDAGLAKAREFAKADPGNTLYDLVSADLLDNAGRARRRSHCSKRRSRPSPPTTASPRRSPASTIQDRQFRQGRDAAECPAKGCAERLCRRRDAGLALSAEQTLRRGDRRVQQAVGRPPGRCGLAQQSRLALPATGRSAKGPPTGRARGGGSAERRADRRHPGLDPAGARRRRQGGDLSDRGQCLGPSRPGDPISPRGRPASRRPHHRCPVDARKAARLRRFLCRQGAGPKAAGRVEARLELGSTRPRRPPAAGLAVSGAPPLRGGPNLLQ